MRVFGAVQPRKHRPAIGAIRLPFLPRCSKAVLATRCSVRVDALMVAEAAQHRFVGGERFRIAVAQRFGHAVRQNALRVADRCDDARNHIIKKLKS